MTRWCSLGSSGCGGSRRVGFGVEGEAALEVGEGDREAGFALEDDNVFGAKEAMSGGGGEAAAGEEVGGGGVDLGEVVDLGVLEEGGFEGFEGGDGGIGGGFGEVVPEVVVGAEIGIRIGK
ncbi:hypothetical protein C1H46_000182 [Malus baccata]|uniref:Uncharacterized protein n=1 Tax=Malus baccata TaxID=106549 RepID=A0A540NUK4_MALBA|nr:hypothetical protein C1H46_000182 [Malus baccata]